MADGELLDKLQRFNYFIFPPIILTQELSPESLKVFKEEWCKINQGVQNSYVLSSEDMSSFEIVNNTGFDSMEQLWLAFVMKEKYNKQWNFETKEWEVRI
jgi:hypothetical protein